MKKPNAHPAKSAKVKAERGFSPEEIFTGGTLIKTLTNPRHPGQELYHVWFDNYVWEIPVDVATGRLITAYKSRKLKKEYGK